VWEHAAERDVRRVEASPYGQRYVIVGVVRSPNEKDSFMRSIWFIEMGEETPRFVTAYAVRGRCQREYTAVLARNLRPSGRIGYNPWAKSGTKRNRMNRLGEDRKSDSRIRCKWFLETGRIPVEGRSFASITPCLRQWVLAICCIIIAALGVPQTVVH